MNWLNKIVQVFKIKELRTKILFVLGVFVVFRIMAAVPMPGIDAQNLKDFFNQFQVFGLLNLFTGGTLANLSIAMLGLGPYITGTIIMQLLTMIFPPLERMYKEEGDQGRRKFNQYGRILAVPLAMLQGYAMLSLFQKQGVIGDISGSTMIVSLVSVAAGCLVLMWLGELITEKGIGNGVSLLIFAGIVAGIPESIYQMIAKWDITQLPVYLLFFGMSLLIVAGVVLVNEARRNIPVSYAKRVRGGKMYGGASTYLPLNINPAGVIPIIFALSIMLFPSMIANLFAGAGGTLGNIAQTVNGIFQNPWIYGILYFLLVCIFTYFYTAVTFDPKAISQNLQKMGGFIPGIRPGESTAHFLYFILNRVLLIGALFLGTIAVIPSVIQGATGITAFSFLVGGTSLLIVVSVILETMRQVNAQLQMRDYETF
jgi:preprotein translocase subunit SecY